jgi:3-oxoacyl-(acyl-carrier-protein) synthase
MRRVVVTGLGVVSCLGNNQQEVYQSLLNSKSGISFHDEYKAFSAVAPSPRSSKLKRKGLARFRRSKS